MIRTGDDFSPVAVACLLEGGEGDEVEVNTEALGVVPASDAEVTELTKSWVQAGENNPPCFCIDTVRVRLTPTALHSKLSCAFWGLHNGRGSVVFCSRPSGSRGAAGAALSCACVFPPFLVT